AQCHTNVFDRDVSVFGFGDLSVLRSYRVFLRLAPLRLWLRHWKVSHVGCGHETVTVPPVPDADTGVTAAVNTTVRVPGAPPVPVTVAPGDGNACTLASARSADCNAADVNDVIEEVVFAPTVAVYAVTPDAMVNV